MFVYHQDDIKRMDRQAVEQGFSMYALMENAGSGLFQKIFPILSNRDRIIVLAGKGNNGGDGIVLARYFKQSGYDVSLTFPLGKPKTEAAIQHQHYYEKQGFIINTWDENSTYDVIIDCLLGIGTRLPLRKEVANLISWCNQSNALKVAIDLPTGVTADHGETNKAFQADYTFCLHGAKPSAFLLPSGPFYGDIQTIDIGLKHTSNIRVLEKTEVQSSFPHRENATHKGTFGSSLLVAGSDEMPGSALLGAIGAMRCGTGKLIIATSKFAATIIAPNIPEATYMLDGLQQISDGVIDEKIAAAGIGPGIADTEKARVALSKLIKSDIPLVVDAGALISLESWKRPNTKAPIILTPHPGEFSRLTKQTVKDIQANRMNLAQQFSVTNEVTVVLKGFHTVIAYPDGNVLINSSGNSALAKGGSGDVLTGMMMSMLTTHTDWREAVANAVYIHGLCANQWSEHYSKTSMIASDFDKLLPKVLREIEDGKN